MHEHHTAVFFSFLPLTPAVFLGLYLKLLQQHHVTLQVSGEVQTTGTLPCKGDAVMTFIILGNYVYYVLPDSYNVLIVLILVAFNLKNLNNSSLMIMFIILNMIIRLFQHARNKRKLCNFIVFFLDLHLPLLSV